MAMIDLKAGPELDRLIRDTVMGVAWDETRCRVCGWPLADTREEGCVLGNCSQRPPPSIPVAERCQSYSTDLTAAAQVETMLGARLRWPQYINALRIIVKRDCSEWARLYGYDGAWDDWCLLRATPLQRCLAALKSEEP